MIDAEIQIKEMLANKGNDIIHQWLQQNQLTPFEFQEQAWQAILNGQSGLINAPTGCGKTYSVFLGALMQFIQTNPTNWDTQKNNGLQLLWITPLRALAKDIGRAMEEVIEQLGLQWKVAIRNGDTSTADRAKQKRQMPEVLIITPESLHLLLTQKNYPNYFSSLKILAVDEWHELMGSKRGVQTELAISRIAHCTIDLQVWGISATIGNLVEAKNVLLSPLKKEGIIIKANINKPIEVHTIIQIGRAHV